MIPYFTLQSIAIGPFVLHLWGLMVALGLLGGAYEAARLARQRGLDSKIIWDVAPWIIIGAIVLVLFLILLVKEYEVIK